MQVKGQYSMDGKELLVRALKYMLEGIVVAFAAAILPNKKPDAKEVILIGLIAAATFALLDLVAPSIGASLRSGAGIGMGLNLVRFPGAEGGQKLF